MKTLRFRFLSVYSGQINYRPLWFASIIAIIAIVIYLPSIDNDPVYDDAFLIQKDLRIIEPGHFQEIWTSDYWPGNRPSYNYRPLTTSSYALVSRLSGNSIYLQRVMNITLHALCSISACFLTISIGFHPAMALLAGSLFAVHPIHSEAVYMVVGRGELLATLFGFCFLTGLLSGRRLIFISLLFGAAIFSKESAVILPVLGLILYRLKYPEKPWQELGRFGVRLFLSTLPFGVLLFLCRYYVFGVFLSPEAYVDPLYNPLSNAQLDLRLINSIWAQFLYLKKMFWPFPLRADYSYCQIELIKSLWDIRTACIPVLIGLLVYLTSNRKRLWGPETCGLMFILIALFPVSNLLFTIGVIFGERLTYLPSFGFCLAISAITVRFARQAAQKIPLPISITIILALLLLSGGGLIIKRDRDWQNAESFTSALVKDSPRSAHAHGLRFLHLEKTNRRNAAEEHLLRALEIYPAYYDAWASYGDFLRADARYEEAVNSYFNAAEEVSKTPFDKAEAGGFLLKAAWVQMTVGDCSGARQSIAKSKRWGQRSHPMLRTIEKLLKNISCNK
ncbi:MAG: DUF1736 domain-containing protein [Desulfobacterales bacterium]|nr:DUF1736 domain-containing protein [Desulfobacterales bacterium]